MLIILMLIIHKPSMSNARSQKNLGPIGWAVLTFIGYKQTNRQTNRQTDRQAKFIYRRQIFNPEWKWQNHKFLKLKPKLTNGAGPAQLRIFSQTTQCLLVLQIGGHGPPGNSFSWHHGWHSVSWADCSFPTVQWQVALSSSIWIRNSRLRK